VRADVKNRRKIMTVLLYTATRAGPLAAAG